MTWNKKQFFLFFKKQIIIVSLLYKLYQPNNKHYQLNNLSHTHTHTHTHPQSDKHTHFISLCMHAYDFFWFFFEKFYWSEYKILSCSGYWYFQLWYTKLFQMEAVLVSGSELGQNCSTAFHLCLSDYRFCQVSPTKDSLQQAAQAKIWF